MRAQERGAALLIVLIALAALMPLALLLSDFAWRRQRQVNARQQDLGGQAAARGALDLAMARIQSGRLDLRGPGQSEQFELEEPESRPVRVRVNRQTDAVLSLEGSIQGLNLKEFFLLLSSTGLAYRRCELVRVNGSQMDIQFIKGKSKKRKAGSSANQTA